MEAVPPTKPLAGAAFIAGLMLVNLLLSLFSGTASWMVTGTVLAVVLAFFCYGAVTAKVYRLRDEELCVSPWCAQDRLKIFRLSDISNVVFSTTGILRATRLNVTFRDGTNLSIPSYYTGAQELVWYLYSRFAKDIVAKNNDNARSGGL